MEQKNSLATSMKQTIEYSNLEFVGDIGEIMIDTVLKDGVLKDVPILGTIVGVGKCIKNVYDISPNTTELVLQWETKYDAYENEEQPWFISYDGEEWESATEEEYTEREASLHRRHREEGRRSGNRKTLRIVEVWHVSEFFPQCPYRISRRTKLRTDEVFQRLGCF